MAAAAALTRKLERSAFEVVDLTPQQNREWEKTRAKFMWDNPAFCHMLYSMMNPASGKKLHAVFTKDVPIAATDGLFLILNPDTFFKDYSLDERVFIVGHEVLHAIFAHMILMHNIQKAGKVLFPDGTSLPFDEQCLQHAADYVINAILVEANVGKAPKDVLLDPKIPDTMSVIDAYKIVYKQKPPQGGGGGGTPQGKGKGKPFDQHLKPGTGKGQTPQQAATEHSDQAWKTALKGAMTAAAAQGRLPASLKRLFEDELQPKVSWEDHIFSFFARKVGSGAWSLRTPDKRMISRPDEPIFAAGRRGFGCDTIVVGVDTSGSIDQKTLAMFFAEMAGILEELKPKQLVIMWCDAKVHRVDELEDVEELRALRAKGAPGGGGTSFRPVFEKVRQLGIDPDAVVYLTDGLGSFPDKPSYPVLWGSILSKPSHFPWGDVVMIPKQA